MQPAGTLSGGQQQRVAIARALMQQPKMLLADEPIASLDPLNAKIVMDALRDINEREGITVVTNLHTLDTARNYCERIIGMAHGSVVFDGQPQELTAAAVAEIYGTTRTVPKSTRSMTSTSINLSIAAQAATIRIRRPQAAGTGRTLRETGRDRRPASRAASLATECDTGDTRITGEEPMLKKTLLAAPCAFCARRRRFRLEDLKEFRVGILGGENEADRLRNYPCLADHLKDDLRFREGFALPGRRL